MVLSAPPKALFFDVFGTCVDWRTGVTDALWTAARAALDSSSAADMASSVRSIAADMTYEDWSSLAQAWRNTYLSFTRSLASDPSLPFKTVDQHHFEALRSLLQERGLSVPDPSSGSLFSEETLLSLSLCWHHLPGWPDASRGISLLNSKFPTSSLSNGNLSLLSDLAASASLPFTHLLSAELFRSYKPSPEVYLGAARHLGLKPQECMLVAAHLDDLAAAKRVGFSAAYVWREREERHPELLAEGIPDVDVGKDEDGFVALAAKLGIEGE